MAGLYEGITVIDWIPFLLLPTLPYTVHIWASISGHFVLNTFHSHDYIMSKTEALLHLLNKDLLVRIISMPESLKSPIFSFIFHNIVQRQWTFVEEVFRRVSLITFRSLPPGFSIRLPNYSSSRTLLHSLLNS